MQQLKCGMRQTKERKKAFLEHRCCYSRRRRNGADAQGKKSVANEARKEGGQKRMGAKHHVLGATACIIIQGTDELRKEWDGECFITFQILKL
jgi:hypothetical protein